MRRAALQAEDRRFFAHGGVDYRALAGSLFHFLTSGRLRGASTISMQLASQLDPKLRAGAERRSLLQKWRQIRGARDLESGWRKEEILETYLNLITFSGELQGVAAASRILFGKDPHGLDAAESLLLASRIRSPNAAPARVVSRASRLGGSLGWNIAEEAIAEAAARASYGTIPAAAGEVDLAPHAARRLMSGKTGRAVASTLNAEMQRFAAERLPRHLLPLRAQNAGEGAVLVVENRTGDILAYASYTRNPSRSGFVDGVTAKRQAGSTLKPFLYAAAFDLRILTPASLLIDAPLAVPVSGGIYRPRNYDGIHRGAVTVRNALAASMNVPAVRAAELVGIGTFLDILRGLGVKRLNESPDFYGPSVALGTADVTLWELVNAYRTLANGGIHAEMRFTPDAENAEPSHPVFSREAAFLVSDILSDREARSATFGLENVLSTRFPTAVKTGTSKDMRDNWCIGYSQRYTVGVWVGNFSGEPMWDVSGLTGAAPLWLELMNRLHREGAGPLEAPPPGLVRRPAPVGGASGRTLEEWFIRGTEPPPVSAHRTDPVPRIVYPPREAVFALDPDIPPALQRIFFTAAGDTADLHWTLNGRALEDGGNSHAWEPVRGPHLLALRDSAGTILDSVKFQVRGTIER
jgi:penicillin-binding protein 1C